MFSVVASAESLVVVELGTAPGAGIAFVVEERSDADSAAAAVVPDTLVESAEINDSCWWD